jgi:hypothetical protein
MGKIEAFDKKVVPEVIERTLEAQMKDIPAGLLYATLDARPIQINKNGDPVDVETFDSYLQSLLQSRHG